MERTVIMSRIGQPPTNRTMKAITFLCLLFQPLEAYTTLGWTRRASTSRFVLQEKLTGQEINARLEQELERLREKDRQSLRLKAEDLKIVFEDDHIIVVDKPSGVLSVPSAPDTPSLVQTVHEYCSPPTLRMDQMVVHRLGMDTSGLMVFAKTIDAVRGMNALFRTRKITRQYEGLVCGHVANDEGSITLPLMRDYEHPPYMRVSTDDHQAALVELDPTVVGKKLLEAPKASLTHYSVIAREELKSLPVTRLTLTSISGRTHQLNVHCAAMGHPIVQDSVYGYQGEASAFGGLSDVQVDEKLLADLKAATSNMSMCVHAKYIKFQHPATKEVMEFTSAAPF